MGTDESHLNVSLIVRDSHKTVSTNHKFWRERRTEAVSNRGPSAYQPTDLPLGQTGSRRRLLRRQFHFSTHRDGQWHGSEHVYKQATARHCYWRAEHIREQGQGSYWRRRRTKNRSRWSGCSGQLGQWTETKTLRLTQLPLLTRHTPSIAFRHLPPNSARFSYATEGAVFISVQLSEAINLVPKHARKHEKHLPRVKKRVPSRFKRLW